MDPSSGTINFSEEVGKTFLWKSIAKPKDKEPKPSEKKEQTNKQSPNEKQSRGSALKKRFLISFDKKYQNVLFFAIV